MPLLKTDAPGLQNIDRWINTDTVELDDGMYLLYFWNYSCNCCRNRLKLFQRIHQEHPEIEVVGVHTPEFDFEQNEKNLEKAVEKLEINHPIAHDRDGEVSSDYNLAYSNWSVIIQEGSIVYQHTHNRDSKELTRKIAEILETEKEINTSDLYQDVPLQEFFGYARASGLNEEGNYPGEKDYQLPENRKKNEVYLKGKWEQTEHFIEAKGDSELRFNFESSEINLIVDPNDSLRDIEVLIDGEPVSEEDAGEDLRVENGKSYIRLKHPDLYNLVDSKHQESEITVIPDRKTRFYALSFK